MNDLMIKEPLTGLEQSKAAQIEKIFVPMVNMLKGFEKQYDSVMAEKPSKDSCNRAKELRKKISKIRINAEKEKTALKKEYLMGGNAVQGVYNILKFAVSEKEEKLKERETHFERMEEQRLADLQIEREEELAKYDIDGSLMRLGEMDNLVWSNFLAGTRTNWENQREAERKAEEQRLALEEKNRILKHRIQTMLPLNGFYDHSLLTIDLSEEDYYQIYENAVSAKKAKEEEDQRIREENERLRREQEAAEKKRKQEEAARKERERKEQEAREAERRTQEKKLQKEREAREKAEEEARQQKEEQARKEREAQAAREAEEARIREEERRAAMAPEKEKLGKLAGDLIKQVYNFDSLEAQEAINQAVKTLRAAAEAM